MTITQSGFLLHQDAQPRVYLAEAVFGLPMSQGVICILYMKHKTKVRVIENVARSGTRTVNFMGSSPATVSNLGRQYALEIRIESCRPHETILKLNNDGVNVMPILQKY